jgi:uncharacterized protein
VGSSADELSAHLSGAREKLERMRRRVRELGSAVVAFSGGVDSTFVLKVAVEELGERAVALTAVSASMAEEERRDAEALAKRLAARHVVVASGELEDPRYAQNPHNRCYFCKSELYALCDAQKAQSGLAHVLDGFNADDFKDLRPGRQAASEHQVLSPLAEVGLTKDEIRALSLEAGLPTWDKPQTPCLASRIPYGTSVTRERLLQIGTSETALRSMGLRNFRVRYHGEIARLEVAADEQARFQSHDFRAEVSRILKRQGFAFAVIDLEPFRSGRLNEAAGLVSAPRSP